MTGGKELLQATTPEEKHEGIRRRKRKNLKTKQQSSSRLANFGQDKNCLKAEKYVIIGGRG